MGLVYKVVKHVPTGYFSAVAKGLYQVRYHPQAWTKASTGGLLVFDNLKAATGFHTLNNWRGDLELWEAQCRWPVKLPAVADARLTSPRCLPQTEKVRRYWRVKRLARDEQHWGTPWPEHTVACKAVKLLRRIK